MTFIDNHQIAEIQVSYSAKVAKQYRIKIHNSQQASKAFMDAWNKDTIEVQEEFKVLLLNRANEVIGIYHASKGGIASTVVDIKLLLATALKACASSILIAHNHPTGELKASGEDVMLTKKLKRAVRMVDLKLNDHLIISKEGYYSMADSSPVF